MRTNKTILTVLTIIFGLFISHSGYSQSLLQKEPSNEVRELADERSRMWTKELALSAKQQDLVEKKIIKYTMKRIEIQDSRLSADEKTERLLSLEAQERGEMRDILTKPQFDRYVFLEDQDEDEDEENQQKIRERQ